MKNMVKRNIAPLLSVFILTFFSSCPARGIDYSIIQIQHRPADELVELVKPLLSETGSISVDANTNSIIVMDREKNLKEIEEFIGLIDIPSMMVRLKLSFFEKNELKRLDLKVNWIYRDIYYSIGNIDEIPSEYGCSGDLTGGVGSERTTHLIEQELLVASGSSGDFFISRSLPIEGDVITYLRDYGVRIEGVTFREVSTGFRVLPVIMGSGEIQLKIVPIMSYFTDEGTGEAIFYEAETTISVPQGETIIIASNNLTGGDVVSDILSGFTKVNKEGLFYIAISTTVE